MQNSEFIGLIKGKRYYFLGIGGASMSALGKYVLAHGGELFGYDEKPSENTKELIEKGAKIYFSNAPTSEEKAVINSAAEIVSTSAIQRGNARLDECFAQGKKVTYRGEFLGEIAKNFKQVVAIAGSHGKTTCTSMCAHIFKASGKRFAAHIGGSDVVMGNYYENGNDYLITEACEYKKNLLYLHPSVSVLLNIDLDHLECYRGESELLETFEKYCLSGETALVCSDDERIQKAKIPSLSFGIENRNAYFTAPNLENKEEKYSFDFCENGKKICRVCLGITGKTNVYNALAAAGAARLCNISPQAIALGLNSFRGVKRRNEKIGECGGSTWYCDYAHHPKEIRSALNTSAALSKGKLFVVFQPHTYSRTKSLMNDFIVVLSNVENLLIFKEYAAREPYDESGSAKRLAERLPKAKYAETNEELKSFTENAEKNAIVLFLGAGDIYERAITILKSRSTNTKALEKVLKKTQER